jgi:hypothetical protein
VERALASRNFRFRRLNHVGQARVSASAAAEIPLKLILVALFLPEGLSFFVGNFRLTLARLLILVFFTRAIVRYFRAPTRIFVPSDFFAFATFLWMLLASVVTDGLEGLKGATMVAVEFVGCYYIVRTTLIAPNSSVRIIMFTCEVFIIVIAIALLDPLTGKLFSYEFTKSITGYTKIAVEEGLATQSDSLYRNGLIRAMGPLEHSILFGCACAWFGTLAYFVFPYRFFGWSVAGFAAVGLWFSQARGAWLAYIIALALSGYSLITNRFPTRWKLIGAAIAVLLIAVITMSGAPIATLMRLGQISPEAAYYRQAIWETAGPLVIHSPLFGIGSSWDWQVDPNLYGSTVDAFWLQNSMTYGVPSTLFVLLTMISPFWRGPLNASPYLTPEERRLSSALGIVIVTAIFLGFIVHFWGTCWSLIGIFPALRANLVSASALRSKDPQWARWLRHRRGGST